MYHAFGLLRPQTDFTLDEAARRLVTALPGATVSRDGDQLTATQGEWSIALTVDDGSHVLGESVGLAEKIAGLADGADLEECARRVEVWSDTPDPFVEHLADFQAVVEMLKTFDGVIAVDPQEPALL